MEREPPKRVYSNNRLKQKTQLKGDEEAIIPGKFQRLDAEVSWFCCIHFHSLVSAY